MKTIIILLLIAATQAYSQYLDSEPRTDTLRKQDFAKNLIALLDEYVDSGYYLDTVHYERDSLSIYIFKEWFGDTKIGTIIYGEPTLTNFLHFLKQKYQLK